ncbi:MAG: hypothetical protein IPP33_13270 [Flavobacteriales bacterium]|nr:hypothetical protein [Flavobacteriales bacterium]
MRYRKKPSDGCGPGQGKDLHDLGNPDYALGIIPCGSENPTGRQSQGERTPRGAADRVNGSIWKQHLRTADSDLHDGKENNPLYMRTITSSLIIAGTVMITTPLCAQEFRLSAGYNGTNVQEAGEEGWTGRGGYMFGADVKLGQRLFLGPGIHFMVRNLNFTYATAADIPAQDYKYTERSCAFR